MSRPVRASWLVSFLLGVGFATVWAMRTRTARPARAAAESPPALDRRTGACDFKNVSLEDALGELSARTQCTIALDWPSLNYLWQASSQVSIGFDDVPLSKAIHLLLWNVTNSGDLAVWETDGVVRITRYGEARWGETLVTRAYDIHDIVTPGGNGLAVDRPEEPVEPLTGSYGGLFGGGHVNWVARIGPYGSHYDNVADVLNLIQHYVDPDSWKENGGRYGTAREAAHLLIVCHAPAIHQQIEALLGRLREARLANNRNAPPVVGGVDVLARPRMFEQDPHLRH